MLSFSQFLTESIRQGLPHISTMQHGQFSNLIHGGKVHLNDVTEKTDGMTHVMGHDENGFYTQSSGSGAEKMRKPEDFHERAKRRAEETGKPYDSTAADAFADVHRILQGNKAVQNHLSTQFKKTGQDTKIRGEVFYKPLSRPSEEKKGEIKFVGTSYDPSHMGSKGKYVIHSKLPENDHIDAEHAAKHFSTDEMNFDTDKINHKGGHVDVSAETKQFGKLNHALITSRTTKTNKEEKNTELGKMRAIQKRVSDKVDAHVKKSGITPKWGSGSEGLVVHPSKQNPDAPRFKVTSDAFREYKADASNKEKFKQRNA
jgi:hypothetical protein